jgi:Putative  PD-(D/E)XK family member, (DUF4420)
MNDNRTYESLRELIGEITPSSRELDRSIVWADENQVVGLARDQYGRIEVFTVCREFTPITSVVRGCLEFQRWYVKGGSELEANRFVLPNGAHFDAVAALICVELIGAGASSDPITAFHITEPVIALALKRAALSNESLVGLAGELAFLNALLRTAAPGSCDDVLAAWTGSGHSTRDFQLGVVGIEVKATTGSSSHHFIHGLGQVELGESVDGVPETSLFLLSLGIRWLDTPTGGYSLPDLVDSVAEQLPDSTSRQFLFDRIQQYGGDAALGYNHKSDRSKPMFQRRFELKFERLYDLTDPEIRILRRPIIQGLDHMNGDSISFRVELPTQVRGDVNPISGLAKITQTVLQLAGLLPSIHPPSGLFGA